MSLTVAMELLLEKDYQPSVATARQTRRSCRAMPSTKLLLFSGPAHPWGRRIIGNLKVNNRYGAALVIMAQPG